MLTIDNFLDLYLQKGFGSMNKNDFEVWIFSQLLNGRLKSKSNYEISISLKLPESKVKRLRYEADLKYSNNDEACNFIKLNEILKKVTFKEDRDYIQFVIEDVSLRRFIDSCLKRDNRFSDSSFNSEIVKINLDDLEYLLCEVNPDKSLKNKLLEVRKTSKNEDLCFKSLFKKFFESMATEGGKKCFDLSVDGLVKLMPILVNLCV